MPTMDSDALRGHRTYTTARGDALLDLAFTQAADGDHDPEPWRALLPALTEADRAATAGHLRALAAIYRDLAFGADPSGWYAEQTRHLDRHTARDWAVRATDRRLAAAVRAARRHPARLRTGRTR